MIARPLPRTDVRRNPAAPAPAAAHTKGRRARTKRRAYRDAFRVVAGVSVLTLAVMVYLGLLANVTKLHYEIGQAQEQRALLEAQTQRLEERLNGLRSDDALLAIATKLQMHDSRAYAVVSFRPKRRSPSLHDSGTCCWGPSPAFAIDRARRPAHALPAGRACKGDVLYSLAIGAYLT